MASIAIAAQGSNIKIRTAAGPPAVFTTIAGVTTINGFDGERPDVDVSDLASVAREYRLGLKDNGNVTLEGFRDDGDTGQAKLRTELSQAVAIPFEINLSNADKYTFNALVKQFTIALGVDESVRFTASLKIDGDVTYAPGP